MQQRRTTTLKVSLYPWLSLASSLQAANSKGLSLQPEATPGRPHISCMHAAQ